MRDALAPEDWVVIGISVGFVVLCLVVLVFFYRHKYRKTLSALHMQAKYKLNRYVAAEQETIRQVHALRERMQGVLKHHEREKSALEHQIHKMHTHLKDLNVSQVRTLGNNRREIEKVQEQMVLLKKRHNDEIEQAQQEIVALKEQLNALRWRL